MTLKIALLYTTPIGGDFLLWSAAASNNITYNKLTSNRITYDVFASNRIISDVLLHSCHRGRNSLSLLSGTVFLQTSQVLQGDPSGQPFCSLRILLAEEHLH